jgi:predicted permease
MRHFLADIRYALRALRAQPTFSVTAILTLALGIGVTTTMFGVVNGIVLKPLPFPDADRLVTICTHLPGNSSDWCSISPPNAADIAARSRSIAEIGVARSDYMHMKTSTRSVGVNGGIATPGMFRALGARAQRGRLLEESDLLGRASDVAVLTHELWQTEFSGDPNVVGRSVLLDGHPTTIVGVLDSAFAPPQLRYVKLWRTLDFSPTDETNRNWPGFVAYAHLKPGVSVQQASAELTGITAQLRREHFTTMEGWDLSMRSLQDLVVGRVRPILLILLAAVSLVLLIACANVANLLLARSAARGHEIVLRAALGAARRRIVSSLLAESFVLALAGAALGVAMAMGGTAAFRKFAPESIPRIQNVHVDMRVLGFALLLAVLTTVVFGLVPALRAARVDLATSIRESGRAASHRRSRLGTLLVGAELALGLVLVSGAALLIRAFSETAHWNPGFEREHLLTFSLFANQDKYKGDRAIAQLWADVETRLHEIPGVIATGTTSAGPLFGGGDGSAQLTLVGKPTPPQAAAAWYNVSPGYFTALGLPIVRGRDLDPRDSLGTLRAVLVNETFARRYWQGENPVGKRFTLTISHEPVDAVVIGLVKDVAPITPGVAVDPQVYWSDRALPRGFSYFLVRTAVPPLSIVPSIRVRLSQLDENLEPSNVNSMPELIDDQLTTPRFDMLLLVTFAIAALALAAVGTYGLFAYAVSLRTRELGIRIALGASPVRIMVALLRDSLLVAGAAIVLGLVGAIQLARVVQDRVPGVSGADFRILLPSALVLLVVALVASLIPARRAGTVDPVVTLTAE